MWLAGAAGAQAPAAPGELRSVRIWSGPEATRVVVELSRETKWKHGRLSSPERLFIDFAETRPRLGSKQTHVLEVGDSHARRVRVAMKDPRTTRLVLDLAGDVDYELSHLTNPERLVIELRDRGARAAAGPGRAAAPESAPETAGKGARGETAKAAPKAAVGEPQQAPGGAGPAKREGAAPRHEAKAPDGAEASQASRNPNEAAGAAGAPAGKGAEDRRAQAAAEPRQEGTAPEAAKPAGEAPPQPARPMRSGGRSMTRALGLRIGRVVLDPGHGGHDEGTRGATGLVEKELVLDVALRLGALIEDRLGSEVVFTRKTDEYVGLEERTAIANEQRADLFLSIHANSSPVKRVSGAEVFFLNFTNSKEALDLAARENAGHNKSIFELRELLQKIALSDKLDESREFARFVQVALSREWKRMNPASRDRGVKMAPFVVLIGASMPSVLAEIGFLSNTRDERLLKRPEYRQRLAEALFRGVESYAASLGQTQALRAATPAPETQSAR